MTARAEAAIEHAERAVAMAGTVGAALNAFSQTFEVRAGHEARNVRKRLDAGEMLPLAGFTYGVKNLFDVRGIVTLAGSIANRDDPPASDDADLVSRMQSAGAVLIGAHHMGEYAYDFTGENAHYGPTRNPHDTERMTGGSSGGSAAAVAAGIVDIALASDTNGSIRLPAALCGIYGLRPTAGLLSTRGSFPFCHSLDQVGPIAASLDHLALAFDVLAATGSEKGEARALAEAAEPTLRVGRLRGWFDDCVDAATGAAMDDVAQALAAIDVTLPGVAEARAAAFVITNVESGAFHAERLRERADQYDPATRDRFLAGTLLPAEWYFRAQRYRRWFTTMVERAFEHFDILIAPAAPTVAPAIGQSRMTVAGREMAVRPNLGLLTQPVSLSGLPVLTAPVARTAGLPIGVQIIGPRGEEKLCFSAAGRLERKGVIAVSMPRLRGAGPVATSAGAAAVA